MGEGGREVMGRRVKLGFRVGKRGPMSPMATWMR
jgi:hypothetical protein